MDFGLAIFPTDYAVPPGELGPMVEERGFDSLLFPEHTHIPTSRATAYPAGGDLPRHYWHTIDPFVACTAAAATTRGLLVGTGICLVIQRDPITTAKEVASVDHVSGGRFLFGVGAGWNVEEMANHGTDAADRFALLRDRVEAMRAIWTQEAAEYHGRYVDFDPLWSWPKPAQRPHPPILLGGSGPHVADRVLAFADEWLPNMGRSVGRLADRVRDLRLRGRAEQGRDIAVTVQVAPTEPADLERLEEAGVHRCVWYLPARERDRVEQALDGYVRVVEAYRGR
jgi:probable F420-dependent oxidoreductase